MEVIIDLLAIGILLSISYWVYKDALSRGMNATAWTIFVFLLLLFGLPAYFIFRKPKLNSVNQDDEIDLNNPEQKSN